MIFFIEGPSKSGKTTLIDEYLKKHYGIRFKGEGQVKIGVDQAWNDYNWYMHNIIERLDELNNYKIPILWDRGISEGIISDDKWIRLAKAHKHKAVVYKHEYSKILNDRGTMELNPQEINNKYELYRKVFKNCVIRNDNIGVQVNNLHIFICNEMEKM